MQKNNVICAMLVVASAASTAAMGQLLPMRPAYQYPARPTEAGPAGVQIGTTPLFISPFVGVAVGHDSNLFYRHDNVKSSDLYVVSPGFKIDARTAEAVFQASYQGQFAHYTSSKDDDYNDQTARMSLDSAMSRRSFLHLGLDYAQGHDPRGATDRITQNRPDKYRVTTPSALFAYGTPGADGRVEVYGSTAVRRYTNNRATTFLSDRDVREVGGAFYWRVAPRTYAVFDARETEQDYISPLSPLDSKERRYFGGVTWEATAATSGTIKLGRLEKRFENNTFPDSTKFAWEALVSWRPRTYSRFDFYTGRYPTESTGLGSYILSEASGVLWNHAWSSYFNTEVNLRFQKDEYQNFDRHDDIRSLGLRAGYRFRRWLTLGAEYTYTQRDSNIPFYEYDRNLYLLTATLSM